MKLHAIKFSLSLFLFPLLLLAKEVVIVDKSANAKSEKEIAVLLQRGGYIIYLRHVSTEHQQSDRQNNGFDDCSWQRKLSEKGREEARMIGRGVAAMNIPIGEVISSPYCRCKDTARLAFGRFRVDEDLKFSMTSDEAETRYLVRRLRQKLLEDPKNGTNTVLVSHTANLKEATGIWPKPEGVMVVFQKSGPGSISYIGRITPDSWDKVMNAVH